MGTESNPDRRGARLADADGARYYTVVLLVLAGAAVVLQVAAYGPLRNSFWGFHLYSFLPLPLAFANLALLVAAAIYLLRANPEREPPHRLDAILRRPAVPCVLLVAVFTALFWFARSQQTLLGDAAPLIADLPGGQNFHPRQPLTMWLQQFLYQHAGAWLSPDAAQASEVARRVVGVGSVAAGGLFVIVACGIGRAIAGPHRARPVVSCLATVVLLTQGYALLFFGYVENYTFYTVVVGAYLLSAVLFLHGRMTLQVAAAMFVVGLGLHLSMYALAPSFAFLAIWGVSDRSRRRDAMGGLLVGVVGVAALAWLLEQMSPGFSLWSGVLDMTHIARKSQGGGAGLSYIFSAQHLRDFTNEQFLIGPLAAALFLPAIAYASVRNGWRDPVAVFLALASLVYLLGSWAMSEPLLGYARDWDLFAPAAICYTTTGLYLLLRHVRRTQTVSLLLGFAAVFSVVQLSPWVRINHSEAIALERFKTLPLGAGRTQIAVGNWYLRNGQTAEAEAWFMRAIEVYPHNASAYAFLGGIYSGREDYDNAVRYYGQAATLRADKPAYHNNYASALIKAGHYEEALVELRWLIERVPERLDYWRSYSSVLVALGREGDFEEIEPLLRAAIGRVAARQPDDFEANMEIAIVLSDLKLQEEAIPFFRKTLELEPESPAALYNTAMALSRLGRVDEARPLLQHFVALYPGRPEAAAAREWLGGGEQRE